MNEAKLNLGRTLSALCGDENNHGDCFNYGSVNGCDEYCPALCEGKCKVYKNVEDFIMQEKGDNHD